MKKILFFIAIVSFTSFGVVSCSEDDPVLEAPVPNPNPNIGNKLNITSNADFLTLGDTLKLKATSDGTDILDATFYIDGKPIDSSKYVQITIGEVMAQARRAGYIDSEEIKIQFAQEPY